LPQLSKDKTILIITYYWPPSGGAGVQRWLKLTNYLCEMGYNIHVIAPDPKYASYAVIDESLALEIHPNVKVYLTKSFEPLNLYQKLIGKKNMPTAGLGGIDHKNYIQKAVVFLRSNLFIPDPRKYWNKYAIKKAQQLIKEEGIKTIITSSPPHSTQLIGYELKKMFDLRWIVDFRDMWTDIYYYSLLKHSKLSHNINLRYERKVIETANHIVTASPVYIPFFNSKSPTVSSDKFTSIPNGYDPKDFEGFEYQLKTDFVITYTGTISDQYNIIPFLDALQMFKTNHPEASFKLQFVGSTYPELAEEISVRELTNHTTYSAYVPHHESISFLETSYILLVCGPLNSSGQEGGIPAKVYEYMASGRPIIYIGKEDGFVADMLRETQTGISQKQDHKKVYEYLYKHYEQWQKGITHNAPNDKITKYSRPAQAEEYSNLL
jgi:glycosyltransferase involved in cell wall biosynthesis